MKQQWAMIGMCLLLLTMGMSGCDQLLKKNQDHITVNVMVAVYITMLDANNQLVFQRIMQGGLCQATGVIELSKGQYIDCTVTLPNSLDTYRQVAPGYAKLTWDTVNATTNFGDMYDWYPHITVQMKQAAL
jgi:hypothetical protein